MFQYSNKVFENLFNNVKNDIISSHMAMEAATIGVDPKMKKSMRKYYDDNDLIFSDGKTICIKSKDNKFYPIDNNLLLPNQLDIKRFCYKVPFYIQIDPNISEYINKIEEMKWVNHGRLIKNEKIFSRFLYKYENRDVVPEEFRILDKTDTSHDVKTYFNDKIWFLFGDRIILTQEKKIDISVKIFDLIYDILYKYNLQNIFSIDTILVDYTSDLFQTMKDKNIKQKQCFNFLKTIEDFKPLICIKVFLHDSFSNTNPIILHFKEIEIDDLYYEYESRDENFNTFKLDSVLKLTHRMLNYFNILKDYQQDRYKNEIFVEKVAYEYGLNSVVNKPSESEMVDQTMRLFNTIFSLEHPEYSFIDKISFINYPHPDEYINNKMYEYYYNLRIKK